MIFEKLRIIEAGQTASFGEWDGATYPLVITDAAVRSVVALGNAKPVHCRRTHNGTDMLDGYLGRFTNFVYEDGVAYADFELSEALETAYPQEAKFIETMILKEPDMLGVSVMGADERELNGESIDVTNFAKLYSCDIVGLPAATTSLYSNNQKEKTMNKFFSAFASMLKKSSYATETVEPVSGGKITIEAEGEVMAIGDKAFDDAGNPHPDGEVRIKVDDTILVLRIEDGRIAEVKPSEDPRDEQEDEIEDERRIGRETSRVPDEFSQRLDKMERTLFVMSQTLNGINSQFSRMTPKPNTPAGGMPINGKSKLSKEAVAEEAKKFYNR